MGSAGSSKGCGGHPETRTQAAGGGHGGLGSVLGATSSGAACDALLGTPSHLNRTKEGKDQSYSALTIIFHHQSSYICLLNNSI